MSPSRRSPQQLNPIERTLGVVVNYLHNDRSIENLHRSSIFTPQLTEGSASFASDQPEHGRGRDLPTDRKGNIWLQVELVWCRELEAVRIFRGFMRDEVR